MTLAKNPCTATIQRGFTLIEMIIVIAIIGILATVSYPNYTKYLIKTKRTNMMVELQNIANRIQAQKIASGSYSTIALESIYGTPTTVGMAKFPITGTPLYTVKIYSEDNEEIQMSGVNMTSGNWKLKANPLPAGIVAEDGIITLDSAGIKCRSTTCGAGSEWNP